MEWLTILWLLGYVLVLGAGLYRYFVWEFDYFIEQGIPGPTPLPLFGNWFGLWKKKWHEVEMERYKKYGKIYGTFDGRRPNTVVAEPGLVRQILIKDFDNFTNRREFFGKNKYLSNIMSFMNGQRWRETRSALSPAFTSAKVKLMSVLMTEIAEKMVEGLETRVERGLKKIDLKSLMNGFSLDVVASCGFGTRTNCVTDFKSPFAQMAMSIFNSALFQTPLYVIFHLYGNLAKYFPANSFDSLGFFSKMASKMIGARREEIQLNPQAPQRNDFLDIMLECQKESNNGDLPVIRNENILISQVLQFLIAGFESTSTMLSVTLSCLALDDVVQDRLRAEIRQSIQKHGGISYESVSELVYLQQCIFEAIRLHPIGIRLERVCNRTTWYESVKIRKGTMVSIPVYAIHHDPEIYKNPELYDPERFTFEERSKRDPMTYLPFGEGPRSCIASKFALQEMKIALAHIINRFHIFRVFETSDPPNFLEGAMPLLQISKVIVGIEKAQ